MIQDKKVGIFKTKNPLHLSLTLAKYALENGKNLF